MNLSDKQKKMLEGKICPYCGVDSVPGTRDGGKEIMICPKCGAYNFINDGKCNGRLASDALWVMKDAMSGEMARYFKEKKRKPTKEEFRKDLAEYLKIPEEMADIEHLGEKSFDLVMAYFQVKLGDLTLRCLSPVTKALDKDGGVSESPAKCPYGMPIEVGSSACRGCPHYLLTNKEGRVWCDTTMSYFKPKCNNS